MHTLNIYMDDKAKNTNYFITKSINIVKLKIRLLVVMYVTNVT